MLAVNDVGKPCAGEPHARIDGRELETEHQDSHGEEEEQPGGKPSGFQRLHHLPQSRSPRQFSTLHAGRRAVNEE
jgi:hypothetical protein